jgi:hypothetical protein
MKLWQWDEGRQGGGYRKLLLAAIPAFADCYLLHMPEGSAIGPHTDPVFGKCHHRFNIIIKRAKKGGIFRTNHASGWRDVPPKARFVFFRPDIWEHEVTEVKEGDRWVLSIGWVSGKTTA